MMSKLLLTASIVALFLVWLPKPVAAELSCPLFFKGDPNAPEAAKNAFAENSLDAVTICPSAPGAPPIVSNVSSPMRGDQGVCFFSETNDTDSETYMLSGEAMCPRQDDPRYMQANGLSEGLFIALTELARRIASSPSEFDRAVQSPDQLRRRYPNYDAIRASITSVSGSPKFEFLGAGLYGDARYQYVLGYGDKTDCSHGVVRGGEAISLYVDLTPRGLRIIDLEHVRITNGLRCFERFEFFDR